MKLLEPKLVKVDKYSCPVCKNLDDTYDAAKFCCQDRKKMVSIKEVVKGVKFSVLDSSLINEADLKGIDLEVLDVMFFKKDYDQTIFLKLGKKREIIGINFMFGDPDSIGKEPYENSDSCVHITEIFRRLNDKYSLHAKKDMMYKVLLAIQLYVNAFIMQDHPHEK
jgi:hypothetical protein